MLVKLKKYKKRGSFLLTSILAAIVLSFIAQAIVVTATGGFGMITASRNALQAQQYATIDADALKMVDYSELDTYGPLARTAITNISESGWEHEITIGDETDIAGSDDAKQRIAKINIYKTDDTIPRFSLEVPLTSQSSGKGLFPDYSNPQNISLPFTAPNDGFLYIGAFTNDGWWWLTVNGHEHYFNDNYYGGSTLLIPLRKGDTVAVNHTYNSSGQILTAEFFNMK